MPALLVHYTFIKENVDNLDKNFPLMALAGQGPDTFFFYGYNKKTPRKNIKEVRDFGSFLHHSNISEPYLFLLEYANKNEHKELLYKYIKGLFMHYLVDRNCHPYVFYRSGFAKREEDKAKFSFYHIEFEAVLDLLFANMHKSKQKLVKCVLSPLDEVKEVSKMFYHLAKHMNYRGIDEDSFLEAYKDLVFAQKALYSPLGIKKAFFSIALRHKVPNAMCIPPLGIKYRKFDFLNKKKNKWADCVSNQERYESFEDLYQKAKEELIIIDDLLTKSYEGKDIKKDFISFVNDIDHDGFKVNAKKEFYDFYNKKRKVLNK